MGIADKHIYFGGAGRVGTGNPWGVMGEITANALAPLGYEVTLVGEAWGQNNPRFVSEGKVDFGGTRLSAIRRAYEGSGLYEKEGPRKNLRVIANINQPGWLAVAVKWETGITNLGQIKERQLPVRIYDPGFNSHSAPIWAHYGITKEMIESWGGRFIDPATTPTPGMPSIRGEWSRSGSFDIIIDNLYLSYTPEIRHWHEACVLFNLRFLDVPEAAIPAVAKEIDGKPGFIPHNLYRGVDRNIPTAARGPQTYYARDDMPDDFAYSLAKAYDDNRHLFRDVHLPFSYDPKTVAVTNGLPLHPGAERYYKEMGYIS